MKKYALLLVALTTTLSLLAQDKYNRYMNVYINGELTYQKAVTEVDSVTFPLLPVEPVATPDIDIPSGTLTVPQANAICSTLSNGETSSAFYVKGWVKEIVQETDTTIRTFHLAEKMYADSTFGNATFLAYQVHYLKNNSFVDESQLAVGDFVVIHGELTNANNTYRTVGNGQAYVYSSNNTRKPFVTLPIPTNITIPSEALTVSQARNICSQLEHGAITEQAYFVKGWVKQIHSNHANGVIGYGNGHFYLAEEFYADSTFSEEEFSAYQVYYLNGEKFSAPDQVKEGDYVVIYGKLTNYNDVYETVGQGKAYIYATSRDAENSGLIADIDYQTGEMSCTNFINSTVYNNLADGTTTEEEYLVRGIVRRIRQIDTGLYGNANFYITDGIHDVYCYHMFGLDSTKFVSSAQLVVGDTITVKSKLTNYAGTKELKEGYIVRTSNTFDSSGVDTSTKIVSIAEVLAMNIESGTMSDGTFQISGTITTITEAFSAQYGNATFTITDNSATEEVTIYRTYYLDNQKWIESNPQIQIGDKVTIIGTIRNYYGEIEFINCYMSEHQH